MSRLEGGNGWPTAVRAALDEHDVKRQQGWLVLSPSAEQVVAHTSHSVEEDDPELVIDTILDAEKAAR